MKALLERAIQRTEINCPKCKGQGSIRRFLGKRIECERCKGIGKISVRPEWKFKAVIVFFILFGLMMLIARCTSSMAEAKSSAAVNDSISTSPQLEIIVEKTEPLAEDNTVQLAQCHVSDTYPEGIMQWCELITKYAHEYGIPSDMIAAVMLQESGGDADAYSESGAVGLMQVMPRDGIAASFECINGPCFASRPTIAELQDPEFNIDYGAEKLAELYTTFGDWREALKAYGPMDCGYTYADLVLTIYNNYK